MKNLSNDVINMEQDFICPDDITPVPFETDAAVERAFNVANKFDMAGIYTVNDDKMNHLTTIYNTVYRVMNNKMLTLKGL